MKEMMALVKKDTNNQNQDKGNSGKTKAEKKKAREEHQKRYDEATICKHCGKKPIQKGRSMLGTRSKCSLPSIELEVQQIGNCGVFNRNRVLATRKSD